jgi:starch-binding outer membrane protein, SusD/RagB family
MKLRYLYTSVLLAAFLGSCSKMEEQPYGQINSNTFYKTPQDAEAAIVYAYSILPEVGYYSRGYYIITELPTENLTQKGDAGASNFELDELRVTSTNSDMDNLWTYIYRGIARVNGVINNVPGIAGMSEVSRDQVLGEGHFLRALHYFNLVRLFGEVPIRLAAIEDPTQIPIAKSPIKDVYDLIISDLKKSEQLIKANNVASGRANKVAAQSLLAKVYLHLASAKASGSPGYDFVTNSDEMYSLAKSYASKVVNEQSAFGFTNNLVDIWNIDLYKAAGVNEHIFDASVDRSGDREGSFSKLPNMFLASDRPMEIPYDPSNPSSATINIGQGWGHFRTESAIYNSYASNDKRKTQLIVSKYKNGGTEYNLDINSSSRPFTRKFIDPKRIGDASSANSPVIRFTDILLTFAEAEGPTIAGYSAINKVRSRAGLGDLPSSLSVQAFRDAVIEERALELAFEGQRLFDLRRTNSMDKVLVKKYGKSITSGAYFFPIPQREIDTNPLMKP